MDWALELLSPILVHRLRQRFYLFEGRIVYLGKDDEYSRRTWLRIPVVHALARHESGFFSTSGMESTSVSEDWDGVEAKRLPFLRVQLMSLISTHHPTVSMRGKAAMMKS